MIYMKRGFLLLLVILNVSCASSGVYFSEKDFYSKEEIKSLVKKVAVLPVNYVFNEDYSKYVNQVFSKRNSNENNPIANQKMNGLKLQRIICEEFAKSKQNVTWLTDKEVNDLLNEKQISYHDLRRLSKPALAKELNVDAVIYIDVFVGAIRNQNNTMVGGVPIVTQSTTQMIEFIVEMHSREEDDLVWKAKTVLGKKAFREEKYFREIMQSDLAQILPLD